uniref:Uncharacterized protein n=1 Tax=Anguilla anguilla TaxID=7936 RepID=A0A0E9TF10_ANGAN
MCQAGGGTGHKAAVTNTDKCTLNKSSHLMYTKPGSWLKRSWK